MGGVQASVLRPEPAGLAAATLSAAIEASHVSVTIADMTQPDAPLIFANEAFLQTTGYDRQEIIGRNCRFLQGEDTDPKAVEAMRSAISAGERLRVDLLNYRKSGEPFWNALHLSPVREADGSVSAYVGVQHDVTQVRANREAEQHRQRIEALGRMAGGLAHELNNMLQPLLTLPELVAEALPADAIEARADLAVMQQSAREARDLVSDMLGYTRVARGGGASVDAAVAVKGALSLIERSLHGEVTLRTEIVGEDLLIANLTEAALKQILTNLSLNAADAMGRKGEVQVRVRRGGSGGVRIEVRDTGCGMDEATKARLFEPFFTTKPVGEGAGLGLHVVFDLVRHAGGTVTVESAPGEGACFMLDFPPA